MNTSAIQERTPVTMKDFLISYHLDDNSRAGWIARQLEELGFTTISQTWESQPEMRKAAASACWIIGVLSRSYLQSIPATELAAAFPVEGDGRSARFFPVKVSKCQAEGLPSPIIDVADADIDDAAAKGALLSGLAAGIPKPLIEIVCPKTIAGMEEDEISLTCTMDVAHAVVIVDIQQKKEGLNIDCPDPDAFLEIDRYRFHFRSPGELRHKLTVSAISAAAGNLPVVISCHDAFGRLLVRKSTRIQIAEDPWWVKLFNWAKGFVPKHPVVATVIALSLTAWWVLVHVHSREQLREVIFTAWPNKPKNYFPSHPTWNSDLGTLEKSKQSWRLIPADWTHQQPGVLVIQEGGFAMPIRDLEQAAFYDFDADFRVTLALRKASWAFRVWPQDSSVDILKSQGYRFTLSVERERDPVGDFNVVKLRGFKCQHLGDARCAPLAPPDPPGLGYPDDCPDSSEFRIYARAEGPIFKFVPRVDSDAPNCGDLGFLKFTDESPSLWPSDRYGGIAFMNMQLRRVQLLRLLETKNDTLNKEEPPNK